MHIKFQYRRVYFLYCPICLGDGDDRTITSTLTKESSVMSLKYKKTLTFAIVRIQISIASSHIHLNAKQIFRTPSTC